MFNSNTASEIKDQASELAETAQETLSDSAKAGKASVRKLGRKLENKARDSKKEALALLESLRDILDPDAHSNATEHVIEQLSENFSEWSESLDKELSQVLKNSRIQPRQWLRKPSLLTLSLAVGAGVLVGYALGKDD
ncbi:MULTISPECIES: hypothetical protein [Methylobacillus]|uniref:DUF883 domain-containing protein n=3 Tax=root TaxID=1 RepID=Q1H2C9_METFK|nr:MULTISPECIES: hypothetical protein [Methylobacillus]ABZ07190.1 hypothetical protein ALOHA_HF4000ANIW133B20ctg3g23 [uncultured marine microorganism HF4000_ANIW133B20]ABZ07592.1 hypothetical protein ALOHA_HF4000ANIW137K11ctg3g4 [uncultured marine microorganism HF4000_ANIW137K11]ABE49214.1 hypothetical protein Mfla_0946 [Methylobacillus flagellatus KT]ABE49358.1 hypothetical protein Mfla_1090 [Methylobacillus flagellatus KT]MPS48073.1 hypothetical protein [Methylobacillus sp.]